MTAESATFGARTGGYAPGSYECRCLTCGCAFDGDKRAVRCLPCAERSTDLTSADGEAQPPKGAKATHVGAPACFALSLACQQLNRAFGGFGCYLVGSALERPDWRDIDVRFIMSDDEFEAEFPGTLYENRKDGGTWEMDPKWLILTTAVAGWLKAQTGLPIDFQFQPQTHANVRHKGPRNALGLYHSKREEPA